MRKRVRPKLLDETQTLINHARPNVMARYADVSNRSLDSWVTGWLSWTLNKKYKRPDGTQYTAASPHVREQVRLWVKAGRPYKYDGGQNEETEAEHDRAEKVQLERERRDNTPPLQKKRRRRRQTS